MLVLDSNVAVAACMTDEGFGEFGGEELFAPPLLWSEFYSATHEAAWRGQITADEASAAVLALDRAPLRSRTHDRMREEAWRIAEELGWAKTYDAEYVALASLLKCRLVSLDRRLRRGADRLGFVIGPSEL